MGQMHTELELECLTEDVGTRVPERLSTFLILEFEKFELAIALQRARHVVVHPAVASGPLFLFWVLQGVVKSGDAASRVPHLRHDHLLGQLVRDHLGNVKRRGRETRALFLVAIWQGDSDRFLRHLGILRLLCLKQVLEIRQSLCNECRFLLEFPFTSNDLNLFVAGHFVTRGQLGPFALLAAVGKRGRIWLLERVSRGRIWLLYVLCHLFLKYFVT